MLERDWTAFQDGTSFGLAFGKPLQCRDPRVETTRAAVCRCARRATPPRFAARLLLRAGRRARLWRARRRAAADPGFGLRPVATLAAAVPKMSTGVASGKTSSGSSTPPRRAPNTTAAAIVPSSDRSIVPGSSPVSRAGWATASMRSMAARGPAARSRGRPVVSQCESAFAPATADTGSPQSNRRSREPSSKSAPNSRSSGSTAASKAQTQTMPGAIRPSVADPGRSPAGIERRRGGRTAAPRAYRRRAAARDGAPALPGRERRSPEPQFGGPRHRQRDVGRSDDDATAGAVRRQDGADSIDRGRIKSDRRFIQQPQRRRDQCKACQRKPPSLSGREHAGRECRERGRSRAASAASVLPPPSRASHARFSAAVSPGFTASRCPI